MCFLFPPWSLPAGSTQADAGRRGERTVYIYIPRFKYEGPGDPSCLIFKRDGCITYVAFGKHIFTNRDICVCIPAQGSLTSARVEAGKLYLEVDLVLEEEKWFLWANSFLTDVFWFDIFFIFVVCALAIGRPNLIEIKRWCKWMARMRDTWRMNDNPPSGVTSTSKTHFLYHCLCEEE